MQIEKFSFGEITIDGVTYEHDVVIDHGKIRKRNKKPSKKLQDTFGHTPLSAAEKIPWKCRRLVIGTGAYGNLPVMDDVKAEAPPPRDRPPDPADRRGHQGAGEVHAAHECDSARDVLTPAQAEVDNVRRPQPWQYVQSLQ